MTETVVSPEIVAQDVENAEKDDEYVFKEEVLTVGDDETVVVELEVLVREEICVEEIVPTPPLALDEIVDKSGEPEGEKVIIGEGDAIVLGEVLGESSDEAVGDKVAVTDGSIVTEFVGDNVV